MLKFASKNPSALDKSNEFYYRFRRWFPQPVVALSQDNTQAVNIVKTLEGKMVLLSKEAIASVEVIFQKHLTQKKKMKNVTHGGSNIIYGPPSHLDDWDALKTKKLQGLENTLKETIKTMWESSPEAIENFTYKFTCLFSLLGPENPKGIPQRAHTDYTEDSIKQTVEKVGVKPLVAFTPMHEDGMMLMVFTKAYKKRQKVLKDHHAQYYLYIPYGMLLILPGNVIHAGGFCFGSPKIHANTPKSHFKLTNHRLHFFLCPDESSKIAGETEHNEIYFDDDDDNVPVASLKGTDKASHVDFHISDGVMEKLHTNLLSEYVLDADVDDKNEDEEIFKKKKAKVNQK